LTVGSVGLGASSSRLSRPVRKPVFRKERTRFFKVLPNDGETSGAHAVPRAKEVIGIYGQPRGGTNFIAGAHVTELKV
jgi:hypothetical protein